MLTRAWSAASIAAVIITLGLVAGPVSVAATDPVECTGPWCVIEIDDPGAPPEGGGVTPVVVTPGPSECRNDAGEVVPCQDRGGWWYPDEQCYIRLNETQPENGPDGEALYWCSREGFALAIWLANPPAGVDTLTPEQAARALISTFTLQPPSVATAPNNAGPAVLGVPVWFWVEDPQPLSWGPYSETATLGGQTITATAQAISTRWNMGDAAVGGEPLICTNTGTPYSPSLFPAGTLVRDQHSPSGCSYVYTRMPDGQAGAQTWTATGTTYWQVQWTGGGASGTIDLQAPTVTCTVPIIQFQSVNVPANQPAAPIRPADTRPVTCST